MLADTGLGFSDSTDCKITLDDPDNDGNDGKAGKHMVSVLAGSHSYPENGQAKKLHLVSQESKGDPRVGMIGVTYRTPASARSSGSTCSSARA